MQNPLPLRLKTARKKAGLTQQQLGMRLGMEQSSASARMVTVQRDGIDYLNETIVP